ncbi:MAG: sensor histidine kinase [Winogradskyella sp.]|uniref:sensor histidine kinase n=1 Tax=Winogradskyella sp. TaxID=1883156 RepID=UPI0025FFA720|nr:sensor histidine kinase [Winogradskyella sp.]NRB84862.1 sensor histidine kinase [Winogradskyella sp.]
MLYFCVLLFIASQKEIGAAEIVLISYVIFFTLVIIITFVVFFTVFQRRKNQMLITQFEQKEEFEAELIKTQQEIQDQTLKHVGRELHDNVGQLLSLATMQMNALSKVATDDIQSKVSNASEAIKESLTEVRSLSKSLNSDVIFNLGFYATLENEIQRLNKSQLIEVSLSTKGDLVKFENNKDETILFRILQEFFSNTLKYADAESLMVHLNYQQEQLIITAKDDGKGFDMDTAAKGSGIINMKKRAELINATYNLESSIGRGTTLTLIYPYKLES